MGGLLEVGDLIPADSSAVEVSVDGTLDVDRDDSVLEPLLLSEDMLATRVQGATQCNE